MVVTQWGTSVLQGIGHSSLATNKLLIQGKGKKKTQEFWKTNVPLQDPPTTNRKGLAYAIINKPFNSIALKVCKK